MADTDDVNDSDDSERSTFDIASEVAKEMDLEPPENEDETEVEEVLEKKPEDETEIEETNESNDPSEDGENEEEDVSQEEETEVEMGSYRNEIADRIGLSKDEIEDIPDDKLNQMSRAFDRQLMEQFQKTNVNPGPSQEELNRHNEQLQQQQFAQEQQLLQSGILPDTEIQRLRKLAEDEGYDPEFIKAMDMLNTETSVLRQREQRFQAMEQQRQNEAVAAVERDFDNSLEKLNMPDLFGKDVEAAKQNPSLFESRKQLFHQAVQFSQQTGQPLDSRLVERVAQVVFPEQFDKLASKKFAEKMKTQHSKKLGSGKSRTNTKGTKPSTEYDGYNPQVGEVLDDPEMRKFVESNFR